MRTIPHAHGSWNQNVGMTAVARVFGVLVAGFWVLFAGIPVVGSVVGRGGPWTAESAVIGTFVAALAATVITGWRHARVGGIVGVMTGGTIGVFVVLTQTGRERATALLVTAVPALIVGALFLIGARSRAARPGS